MIYAICRRLTGNDTDALDATQEALIAVVKGLHRYDGRARFSTWAYRVATNACLDELRRRKRRPTPVEVDPERDEALPDLSGDVVGRLDLDAALERLPEEYRAAVVLRDLVGMDYADIGASLGIPPGTVRSRIARGRRALAQLLGNSDHPPRRPTSQP
jgi:RNA polymerase sigma-70 factor (ECF subfamily)